MAQSAEWKNMKLELMRTVVPGLRKAGFTGSFPHLRRLRGSKMELISFFSHSIDGGAFEVGASMVFLDALGKKESNLFYPNAPIDPKKLVWCDGRIRNGLPGVYDGAFYYVDVYSKDITFTDAAAHRQISVKHYTAVTPKQWGYLADHLKANHYDLVQKADSGTFAKIAGEAARQMPELLLWFDKMQYYEDLLAFQAEKWEIRKREAGRRISIDDGSAHQEMRR